MRSIKYQVTMAAIWLAVIVIFLSLTGLIHVK